MRINEETMTFDNTVHLVEEMLRIQKKYNIRLDFRMLNGVFKVSVKKIYECDIYATRELSETFTILDPRCDRVIAIVKESAERLNSLRVYGPGLGLAGGIE